MKQIIFILFLMPSLCFAQLGINVPNPEATLHIKPKGNLPPLVIENIDNKSFDEQRPYNKLIIDDDGIVKQQEPQNNVIQKSRKIYRYNLKKNLRIGAYEIPALVERDVQLMTPDSEIELSDQYHTIKFPKTGNFGIIVRIHAKLDFSAIDTQGKTPYSRDVIEAYTAGILHVHAGFYPNTDATNQHSKSMIFQISQFDNKMYLNAMFEVTGQEGQELNITFYLPQYSYSNWLWGFHNYYRPATYFNQKGPIILLGYEDNKSNKNVFHETTNITMWELN